MKHQITGAQPDISYELASQYVEHCNKYRIGWGLYFLSIAVSSGLAFLYGLYLNVGGCNI